MARVCYFSPQRWSDRCAAEGFEEHSFDVERQAQEQERAGSNDGVVCTPPRSKGNSVLREVSSGRLRRGFTAFSEQEGVGMSHSMEHVDTDRRPKFEEAGRGQKRKTAEVQAMKWYHPRVQGVCFTMLSFNATERLKLWKES